MLGPLFWYELKRLARRGLQMKLRAAFAVLLLVVLFLALSRGIPGISPVELITAIDTPLTTERASRFGERFLVTFLFAQAAVVVLITPAIAAGAIGEEKERGSLDLLLTTQLTNAEIIVGKFLARLAFVAALLLTGLPVVTLVTFLGGVDADRLLAGNAISLLTIVSLGAFTVYQTVTRPSLGSRQIRAYSWAVGLSTIGLVWRVLRRAGVSVSTWGNVGDTRRLDGVHKQYSGRIGDGRGDLCGGPLTHRLGLRRGGVEKPSLAHRASTLCLGAVQIA